MKVNGIQNNITEFRCIDKKHFSKYLTDLERHEGE